MADSRDKFAPHMRAVAEQLLGEPNSRLSTKTELRYGNQGSIKIDLKAGTYYDHQENDGGGVLKLIATRAGRPIEGGQAVEWLREHGFDIEDDRPAPAPRQNASRTDVDGNYIPKHVPDGARLTATYDYRDGKGALSYQVCRYDWDDPQSEKGRGKTFLQRRPSAERKDGWDYRTKGLTPLPYRLPELIEDIDDGLPIFVVEGEKKVDMLRDLGVPATCNHGGAGKFAAELVGHFHRADVTIIPDNDQPGRDHANLVGARLRETAQSVKILDLPDVPPKGSVDDWIPAGGTAEALYELRRTSARAWTPQPPTTQFKAVTWRDIPKPGPTLEPLIKGILTQNEISLLVGESQSGKSFAALDLAMAIARGCDWFGRRVTQGGVVYQAGESAAGLRRRRIPAYSKHHDCADSDLPFVLLQSQIDLYGSDDHVNALAKEAVAWGATFPVPLRLIVIDTFNRATPGANENDGKDMSAIIERCETLRRETGAHIMLVHHMNAGGTKARGHTSLFAAVDSTIHVRKVPDALDGAGRQIREWSISKMKEGEDGVSKKFVLPSVVLGQDDDGDEITSCIVAPPSDLVLATEGDDRGISIQGVNAVMLRAIYDSINDQGVIPPAGLALPKSTKVVERKVVSGRIRDILRDDDVPLKLDDGETIEVAQKRHLEAKRKQAERARDYLFAKGVIGMNDTYLWLTGKRVAGFGPPPGLRARKKGDGEKSTATPELGLPPADLPFDLEDFQ